MLDCKSAAANDGFAPEDVRVYRDAFEKFLFVHWSSSPATLNVPAACTPWISAVQFWPRGTRHQDRGVCSDSQVGSIPYLLVLESKRFASEYSQCTELLPQTRLAGILSEWTKSGQRVP